MSLKGMPKILKENSPDKKLKGRKQARRERLIELNKKFMKRVKKRPYSSNALKSLLRERGGHDNDRY